MFNYWIVGASWGGTEHQDKKFIKEGYWMLGWKKDRQPKQYALTQKIQVGDRIAIKRMKGKGQKGIKICHIGIVKGIVKGTDKFVCTVDWVATNLNRDIEESRGCFRSIHGPFEKDEWIEKIFCV